jgi:hypothetical protein
MMNVRHAIAEELHKPALKNYPRRKVTLKGLDDLYQADLVEMKPYGNVNHGFKYILTVINCLSKFAFAVPLKNKSGSQVAEALAPIFAKHKIKNLQTDQGTDFFNSHVKALTKKYKINHYHTFTELKASIIERLNRTLKSKMYKLFTARGSYEWVSILPQIVKTYNATKHRTIGMKPKDVRRKHVKMILDRIFKVKPLKILKKRRGHNIESKPKFKVGDKVRISKIKKTFAKGYIANWTNETFTIYAVKPTRPVTYILQDSKGEILRGGFYQQELSKSYTGDVHFIEKILQRKGNMVKVRWSGYDATHDSWVKKSDLLI